MIKPQAPVDPKALENEVRSKLQAVSAQLEEQEAVYEELKSVERLLDLEARSNKAQIRRVSHGVKLLQEEADGVLFLEDFTSTNQADLSTTAWVDPHARRLGLYPLELSACKAANLTLRILSVYQDRREFGQLEGILEGESFTLQVVHPKEQLLRVLLEGEILEPANRIRLDLEVAGDIEVALYIGGETLVPREGAYYWDLPQGYTGRFEIEIARKTFDRVENDEATSSLTLHSLYFYREVLMTTGRYVSRPIRLTRQVRSIMLEADEFRPQGSDISYEIALYREGEQPQFGRILPGTWKLLENIPIITETFEPLDDEYGVLVGQSFGVFHYRVGRLSERPDLRTLTVHMGYGQWRVDTSSDLEAPMTPLDFNESKHKLVRYLQARGDASLQISSEWVRLRGFIILANPEFVAWNAPRIIGNGELAVFINNRPQVIDAGKIYASLKRGQNEITVFARSAESATLSIAIDPAPLTIYGEPYPLRRVHIDRLLNEVAKNDLTTYAVDEDASIIMNHDPDNYQASFEARYRPERSFDKPTYLRVGARLGRQGDRGPEIYRILIREGF